MINAMLTVMFRELIVLHDWIIDIIIAIMI
jgi:hypothetical protein